VALDQPASSAALWAISDATGCRPEYTLPTLWLESAGFQPSVQNYAGSDNWGINQISGSYLASLGIAPATYVTWPASQQLSVVVKPFIQGIVSTYGKIILSGTRFYQANLLPGSLKLLNPPQQGVGTLYYVARAWNDPITCYPSSYYTSNYGLDASASCRALVAAAKPAPGCCITVGDLGVKVAWLAQQPAVQQAIAAAYALRPNEKQQSPVYGTDSFGALSKVQTALAVGAIVVGGGALAWSLAGNPWPLWRK
jgi:hypothetical protein